MQYHRSTLRLLGRSGIPDVPQCDLPASVAQWYSLPDAIELLRRFSNDDHPLQPDDFRAAHDHGTARTVFMIENQGVCHWAFANDGFSDPAVHINLDPPSEEWFLHAEHFSTFVYCRVFDFWRWGDPNLAISAIGEPLSEARLASLRFSFTEGPSTHGWPGGHQYRFSSPEGRIVIWASAEQTDWHFASDSAPAVLGLYRQFSHLLQCQSDLPGPS